MSDFLNFVDPWNAKIFILSDQKNILFQKLAQTES